MYLLNPILYCSPLILFTGFRLWTLASRLVWKILILVFYAVLVAAYPLAETVSHRPATSWSKGFTTAGYVCLPILLYLVLFVVLTEIAIWGARLSRLLTKKTVRSWGFRSSRLWISLVVPALAVAAGAYINDHPRFHYYTIEVPRKASALRELTIAFASDFHLRDMTNPRVLDRFAAKVAAVRPDILLLGGDMVEGDRQDEKLEGFEAVLRGLAPKYGIYGVPGNHDSRGGARTFFDKAGIRLLQDTVEKIDDAFYLVGRNEGRRGRAAIGELLKRCDSDLPIIVLDHRPSDLDAVSRAGVDVQLSGHTHNGQLFPVNIITRGQYELAWGYKKKGPTHVFVTSGLQTWGPPIRTAGFSEIMLIKVTFR
jgi:predicted MPP superfamily phosphohydrolase